MEIQIRATETGSVSSLARSETIHYRQEQAEKAEKADGVSSGVTNSPRRDYQDEEDSRWLRCAKNIHVEFPL